MIVLALDTALSAATAVVARDGEVLSVRQQPMARGNQEAIAILTEAAMAEAGVAFCDIDRIGVTVGPGSFTGLRVGLAFAKGLALAWATPLVGLGTLEALVIGAPPRTVAAIDAGRGQVYLQSFIEADGLPQQLPLAEALTFVAGIEPAAIVGSGASLLSQAAPNALLDPRAFPTSEALAALTVAAPDPKGPPQPLYLRAPDAKTLAERGVTR